jgi:hypothetical protein
LKYSARSCGGCECRHLNRPWQRTTFKGKGLARETDFLDLYKDLGLHPDCGLAEFKQAYRRRVAILHPDRQADNRPDAPAADRLQHLTALYGAAIIFERRHGRLPGAVDVRLPQAATVRPAAPVTPRAATMPQSRRRMRWPMVLLAAAAGGAWLLWDTDPPLPSATPVQLTPAEVSEQHAQTASSMLGLGMDADTVRAIEGEPVMSEGDRWEYGPSWIRFERGKVVDWYSSSLRPLRTTTTHPTSARD